MTLISPEELHFGFDEYLSHFPGFHPGAWKLVVYLRYFGCSSLSYSTLICTWIFICSILPTISDTLIDPMWGPSVNSWMCLCVSDYVLMFEVHSPGQDLFFVFVFEIHSPGQDLFFCICVYNTLTWSGFVFCICVYITLTWSGCWGGTFLNELPQASHFLVKKLRLHCLCQPRRCLICPRLLPG